MSWVKERDDEFTELAATLVPGLYRRAYLLTTSQQHAEDLVQTSLAKAYAAWSIVCRADDPAAYIHAILLNVFVSERRRRSSREIPSADPSDQLRDRGDQVSQSDPTDRLVLLEALRSLGDVDRAVVVLRYWEDRSIEQTAALLNLTSAGVRNRSLRALARLRSVLGTSLSTMEEVP
jgi:RNA polymerase sigma-70 factor (sigma-E family)